MSAEGRCQGCGELKPLTKAGKVAAHKRYKPWGRTGYGMPTYGRCEGTGHKPAPEPQP